MNSEIEDVSRKVFACLGIDSNILEGDSNHVLNGTYYSYSVFGIQIQIEKNNYDYDDSYNYMIKIKKNVLLELQMDPTMIKKLVLIIIDLLQKNLKTTIAYEMEGGGIQLFN
ncbi:hypothetical protein Q4E93_25445 [Flavitalea sp. BT771]|uniref:hypothetical protein n=1 Tax=Flavitalea sp. BT771 TaxID=3063329 RepID=UPI0026E40495|nr:hypothetical protein [Flavitalea sp. BT771]MDO6433978.1 hypothetical protein [Flavitalea sp. BT771]MDV6222878.1 hypothetical protein [Flavitalea sp. BT771]